MSGRSLRFILTKVKDPCQWRCPKWYIRSPAVAAKLTLGRQWGDLKPEWRSTGIPVRRGHWRNQCLQSMYGRAITQSSRRRPQWLTRQGPPRSCCWRRQSRSSCSNGPLTGMEDWSCLDAGWQPWEQGSRGDPLVPVVCSHATSGDSKWCDTWL